MTFFRKTCWLAALGGLALACFMVGAAMFSRSSPVAIEILQLIKEFFGIWVIGAVISVVFGVPVLFLIEKYFSRFTLRYMIGGFLSAWIAWLIIAGPLFLPERWSRLDSWIGSGLGHVGIYLSLGFVVGALITMVVRMTERRPP